MFTRLIHADWSIDERKRWLASAGRVNGAWHVDAPCPVGSVCAFLDRAFEFARGGSVLLGFDFPIGLPSAYGVRTGLAGFPQALPAFGKGEWSAFFDVAASPDEVAIRRPFYPRAGRKGVSRSALVEGLQVARFADLLRVCDRKTEHRQAACAVFWTLGPNQVGKAALAGWCEVVRPAVARGAALWPFEGSLAALAARGGVTIAETYPAEAYRMVGAAFRRTESKRRPGDRKAKAAAILDWAACHGVALSAPATAAIEDGFGTHAAGEDAFDALAGLLKMIEVVDGRRPEAGPDMPPDLAWEGWILGR